MKKIEPRASKYSTEYCHKLAQDRGGKFLSEKFLGYSEKHLWQCANPDHPPFSSHFSNMVIRGSWCKTCRHSEASTKALGISDEVWAERCLAVDLRLIKVIRQIKKKTRLQVQCLKNPTHKYIKIADAVKWKTGCQFCNKKIKLTLKDAQLLAKSKRGTCLSTEYKNANSDLLWQCENKHSPWKASYADIKGNSNRIGTWCPECTSGIGERICRAYFEQLFKKKFPKMKPKWLKPDGWMQPLELDGFCEELKLAFEHNGRYHYESGKFFNSGNARLNVTERDAIKRNLCRQNGITLIEIKEIPYLQPIETLKNVIKTNCLNARIKIPVEFDSIDVDLTQAYILPDMYEKLRLDCEARNKKLLSKTYLGSQQAHNIQCMKCGHTWWIKPSNLRQGRGCPRCRRLKNRLCFKNAKKLLFSE